MFVSGCNVFGQLEKLVSIEENDHPVCIRQFTRAVHKLVENAKIVAFAWNHAVIIESECDSWFTR